MKKILVNGLYRSGNNWCESLVENNIINAQADLHHFFAPNALEYLKSYDFHIMLYKNPYHWVNSIIKQSWDMPFYYDLEPTDNCYKIEVGIGYPLENIKETSIKKKHVISLQKLITCYNNYFYFWSNMIDVLDKPYFFIQYEQILKDPQKFVNHICVKTGLQVKQEFRNLNSVNNSRDWQISNKDYYLSKPNIDKEMIPIINEMLDSKIMRFLKLPYLD